MPMSSVEISALTGAYQQQGMAQMQYAGMIGNSLPEGLMGGAMNRAYATGAPLLQGAMGLVGLDPFSLGLKAAGGVWGAGGGVLGAGLAGIGTAGAAAGGLALAGYAGNQMYVGAQQQQQLNAMIRSSFPTMSPYGQGMSRSDLGTIGGSLRSLTHQAGPGGEVIGFGELSQLAANMGRMGMGQGIRDAQQFSQKFREMLNTLKTVATELNTTLDGAQQFLAAQRASGIFRSGDQAAFAMRARGTALAGGLALSEVTGAASIGSQISRSIGGLGRSGAFGGMRAIGQIGSAMQVGALTEEDVYNTTGLTGAEGRQALGASMMQQTGRFLQSSKGRWFLASVAGRNGQLDEGSVQNWLMGGMDVADTKRQAYDNLSKVGRANFIRNEGRLRGSVIERFGALAPAMALMQWASGRGVDINNMDDRSMLFAQRQLGMGRDEVDTAVKLAQSMPEILRQQRLSGGDDEYSRRVAAYQRGHGIEGMKRRLEHIREGVQGKLQQVGADIFTSGSDMIEQWFNKLSGVYERRLNADVDEIWKSAKMGGRGAQDLHRMLAGGGTGSPGVTSRMLAMVGVLGSSSGVAREFYDRSNEQRFAAMVGAIGPASAEVSNFAKANRDVVRDAYTTGMAGEVGTERMSQFRDLLKRRADAGDASAKAMWEAWKKASPRERAGMLGSIEKSVGISDKVGLGASWELPETGLLQGSFATVREGDVAVGRQILGEGWFLSGDAGTGRSIATALAAGTGVIAGTSLDLMGSIITKGGSLGALGSFIAGKNGTDSMAEQLGTKFGSVISGGESLAAAAGGYLRSKRGLQLVGGMMAGDKGATERAADRIQELQLAARKAGGMEDLSEEERAEYTVLGQATIGQKYAQLLRKGGSKEDLGELVAQAEKMLGKEKGSLGEGDLRRFLEVGQAGMALQARDQIEHLSERAADEMGSRRQAFQAAGVAHYEKIRVGGQKGMQEALVLNKKTREQLTQEAGAGGAQAAEMALTSMDLAKELTATADPARKAELLEQMSNLEGQRFEKIAELSTSQKKALAKRMAGTEVGAEAGESLMREQRMKSLVRSQGGGSKGQVGAIAAQLGLSFGKEQLEGLAGKSAEELAGVFAGQLGDSSDAFKKDLQKSIEAMKSGKVGQSADLLQRTIEQSDEKTKKKIKEGRDGEDPVASAIKEMGGKQVELLKLIAKNKPATAEEIAQAVGGGGNPEAAKKP